jgi:hypothetical protein
VSLPDRIYKAYMSNSGLAERHEGRGVRGACRVVKPRIERSPVAMLTPAMGNLRVLAACVAV